LVEGSIAHVAGVLFRNETGTRVQFVPYRGIAPAIQDLVAGQIEMVISDPVAALAQVRAGTIKAYGVTTKTRLLSAPDIPTLDEAGLVADATVPLDAANHAVHSPRQNGSQLRNGCHRIGLWLVLLSA
jgi:tripartite-type tricarboxylate transporter receptor subunit TctC